jgi:hypothetical protein
MVHAVEPALNAFAITFEGRITPSAAHPYPGRIHRRRTLPLEYQLRCMRASGPLVRFPR